MNNLWTAMAVSTAMVSANAYAQSEIDYRDQAPRGIPQSSLVPLQLQRAGPPARQTTPEPESEAPPAGGVIHLICLGAGTANKLSMTSAFAFNNFGGSAWGQAISERAQAFEDQVNVQINEDDTGRIRLPRVILPMIRGGENGWMKLKDIKRTDVEITGTATVNPVNNPKVRLDRSTGHISIDGKAGQYSGVCDRYDPAASAKKF